MLRTAYAGLLSLASLSLVTPAGWSAGVAQLPSASPSPAVQEIIPVQPPQPVVVRPMTVAEFAAHFRPAPGTYEVLLLHPRTGCPVNVCFTLPPGCPKKVRVRHAELEFDYGKHEVEIQFRRDGRATVRYR